MKKIQIMISFCVAISINTFDAVNAQCYTTDYVCDVYPNKVNFEGELNGYNTNYDVCYTATNSTINNNCNANEWSYMNLHSLSGNLNVNMIINANPDKNIFCKTNSTDTIIFNNFGNFDANSNIFIDGNVVINAIVINNSFLDGGKAIINMNENSYIKLHTINGTVEGYGYQIEDIIPEGFKVYIDNLIGFKAEGTLAPGHMTGKYVFFSICHSVPLGLKLYDENLSNQIITWSVSNPSEVFHFEIQNSTDAINWNVENYSYPNNYKTYSYKLRNNEAYYRIKCVKKDGTEIYSKVLKQEIENKKIVKLLDVFGNELTEAPIGKVYIEVYSNGDVAKKIIF